MIRWQSALKAGVSLALLGWLARRIDWAAFGRQIGHLDGRWLGPLVLLGPLAILSLAFRWELYLRAYGLPLRFLEVLRIVWGGQFFNSFLPGSTGGDVYKLVAVGRVHRGGEIRAASTVVLDRLAALATLLALACAALAVESDPLRRALGPAGAGPAMRFAWLALVVASGGAAAAFVALRHASAASWLGRVRAVLLQVWKGIRDGLRDPALFGKAAAVSLVVHLSSFGCVYCLAHALGIAMTFFQVLLVMPVVLIVVMLPVTINGHGLREVLLIGYFEWLGLHGAGAAPRESALALSLLFVCNDLLWCIPGGVWFAVHRGRAPGEPPPLP